MKKSAQHTTSAVLIDERAGLGVARFMTAFSFVMVAGFIAWSMVAKLLEVSQAQGSVLPRRSIQLVQHIVGGKVESVFTEEGQHVMKGQPLVKFDDKAIVTDLGIKRIQLNTAEKRLISLQDEYTTKSELVELGLYARLNLLEIDRTRRDLQGRADELKKMIMQAEASRREFLLTTPSSGIVFKMRELNIGSVVRSGDTILEIVPDDEEVFAEVRIQPSDIGHVRIGQEVRVKFTAYDEKRYGTMMGTVAALSPSTMQLPDGSTYYRGRVALRRTFVSGSAKETPLRPGMMLTADIKTGSKTVMEYLLKPIFSSANHAFQER